MNFINQFWEDFRSKKHAQKYGAKIDNLIKWDLKLKDSAQKAIENNQINLESDHWNLFQRFAKGEVITNKYGKKLYFKQWIN